MRFGLGAADRHRAAGRVCRASCRRPTCRTTARPGGLRPGAVGDGDPGGGGDRRHRQRRAVPPADGDQGATTATATRSNWPTAAAADVSAKTSAKVRDLMQAVIDSHNGQNEPQAGRLKSGGKTGTAQLANTKCGCYKGYVTSYVGFAPIDDPQLLTYVVISTRVTATPARRSPRRSIKRSCTWSCRGIPVAPNAKEATSRCPRRGEKVTVGRERPAGMSSRLLPEWSDADNVRCARRGCWSHRCLRFEPRERGSTVQPDGAAGDGRRPGRRSRRRPVTGITLDSRQVGPGDCTSPCPAAPITEPTSPPRPPTAAPRPC